MREIRIETNGGGFTIGQPLCGWDWLNKHLQDHTHAEIEALTIELSNGTRRFATVSAGHKRGTVRDLVNLKRGG